MIQTEQQTKNFLGQIIRDKKNCHILCLMNIK